MVGEPTEAALCTACQVPKEALEARWPREGEIPFSSARKRMATFHRRPGGGYRVIVKGAPDLLVERCSRLRTAAGEFPLTPAWREKLRRMNESMAGEGPPGAGGGLPGYRYPAQGGRGGNGLDLLRPGGDDGPAAARSRPGSEAVRGAGIRPVMITGDHGATAAAIAKQLGILRKNGKLLTGRQLGRHGQPHLRGGGLRLRRLCPGLPGA